MYIARRRHKINLMGNRSRALADLERLLAQTEQRAAKARRHAADARAHAGEDAARGDHRAEKTHLREAETHARAANLNEQTAALYRTRIRHLHHTLDRDPAPAASTDGRPVMSAILLDVRQDPQRDPDPPSRP